MKTKIELPHHILQIIQQNAIKLCVNATQEITTPDSAIPDNAVPDTIGVCIGQKDANTGALISNLKNDKNGNILKKYMQLGITSEKTFTLMDENNELKDVPFYFINYDVPESTKHIPTFTQDSPGNKCPINGHYACQYEILLGTNNLTRRMTFQTSSVNESMTEWLENLLEEIETCANSPNVLKNTNIKHAFYLCNNHLYFTMFDEIGIPVDIECSNMTEFKSMIRSIRQLSCKFIENQDRNED